MCRLHHHWKQDGKKKPKTVKTQYEFNRTSGCEKDGKTKTRSEKLQAGHALNEQSKGKELEIVRERKTGMEGKASAETGKIVHDQVTVVFSKWRV